MTEEWADIPEFPGYVVGTSGRVQNINTGRDMAVNINQRGIAYVGIMQDGVQHKRALGPLVAAAFLDPHANPRFNTVVHLDGNHLNNAAHNLCYRPRAFAVQYQRQFSHPYPHRVDDQIVCLQTREVFQSSWEASTTYGMLERIIVLSLMEEGMTVFPHNYEFKIL